MLCKLTCVSRRTRGRVPEVANVAREGAQQPGDETRSGGSGAKVEKVEKCFVGKVEKVEKCFVGKVEKVEKVLGGKVEKVEKVSVVKVEKWRKF